MLSEEEIYKMLLVEKLDKFPLLNGLFAIRDSRGKRNDYTIFVNGYISLDVINKAVEKVNLLDNLKEIEKTHREENGKLRVEFEKVYEDNLTLAKELEQEKEKNKELEEKLKIAKQLYNDACVCIATECVEKDKIKEKIENFRCKTTWGYNEQKYDKKIYCAEHNIIDKLEKELLEEE